MTTGSVSLSASNARQYVSVAIAGPATNDARNPNFQLGKASSLLDAPSKVTAIDKLRVNDSSSATTSTAIPQAFDRNDQASVAKNTASAALNVQINAPLTPATKAAVTQAAASNSLTPTEASKPIQQTSHAQATSQSDSLSTDNFNNDAITPTPATLTKSADNAPPIQQNAPSVTQGNVVQTGAYSSLESTSGSTIRGTGVNVVS